MRYWLWHTLYSMIAPAAERNKAPILEVMKKYLPDNEKLQALEVASGTGQHIVHFATHFKNITWLPSDLEECHVRSIAKHIEQSGLSNVETPVRLDITEPIEKWPVRDSLKKPGSLDLVICINMIHITPFICTQKLFEAADSLLSKDNGILVTYGPYGENGVISPISNVRFDASLRSQNKDWGIRDTNDLKRLASQHGLTLSQSLEMPANNKTLIFKRT